MAPLHLVGGGWDAGSAPAVYGPFLAEATARAGERPVIACVVLDEGDGPQRFEQWAQVMTTVAPCEPRPVIVGLGDTLDPARLGDADGLLVGGGLTPGYAQALVPVAAEIRSWLADGDRPYAGFSAGAAIAATRAIIGGWRSGDTPVCPEDTGEDLDQLTVVSGLGLTKWSVDVHCAQWGTLPRLVEVVRTAQAAGNGLGIDENTVISFGDDGGLRVSGTGRAWLVHRARARGRGHADATVTPVPAGTRVD